MNMQANVTIIIPTLNEAGNIGITIEKIKKILPNDKIIVTDDGSTDQTQSIAKASRATVIDRSAAQVKGITAAVIDAAQKVMTKYMVVMDADLQHPPEKVKEILKKLRKNDIVIGVRKSIVGNWGFFRKMQSKIATSLAHLRLGKRIRDPMSGFFGIRTEIFRNVKKSNVDRRCFKILFNLLKNCDKKKTKISYVFYKFDMRKNGKSKIGMKHVWYFLRNVVK